MKLHLPKGLRTALLAVVALASSANIAQAAPAVYDYAIKTETSELLIDQTTPETLTLSGLPVAPDSRQSWVISFAPLSLWGAPCSDQANFPGGCVVVGNVNVPFKATWGKLGELRTYPKNLTEADFAIYFSLNGNIYAVSKEGGKQLLGTDPKGLASLTQGITPFQITLNWVVSEDGTGSLYYTSGSAASVDWDGYITNGDNTNFTKERITILKDVELTDENVLKLSSLFSTSSADSTPPRYDVLDIITNEYKKGSGDDAAVWQITGQADLAKLTSTTGDTYEDVTEDGTHTTVVQGDVVHFVGDEGVIHTSTDAVYSNDTVADIDVLNGGTTCSIGFGAAAGATLTVTRDALDGEEIDSRSVGGVLNGSALRIVDTGRVKFELGDQDSTLSSLTMTENGTLELNTTANKKVSVSLNMGTISAGNIDRTGSGDLILEFTEVDKNAWLNTISCSAAGGNIIIQNNGGSGSLSVRSISNTTGDIEVKTDTYATSGITASAGDIVIDDNSTVITKSITAGQTAASVAARTTGSDIIVESGSDLVSDSVTATGTVSVATQASLIAGAIQADTLATTGSGTIAANSVSAEVAKTDDIVVESTSDGVLLSGDVTMGTAGIAADKIGKGATITLSQNSKATLITSSMSGADVYVGNPKVRSASVSMTKASTTAPTQISATSTVVDGKLEAEDISLSDAYILHADEIVATDSIVAGDSEFGDVTLTNVQISDTAVTADEISADTVTLEEGYTVNKAAVSATNGTTINGRDAGVVLNNVSFTGAVKTTGKVVLNAVKFQGGNNTFGGANGDVFRVDKDGEGVANVILTGGIEGGDNLTINSMILNAEGLKFAPGEVKTYYLITPKGGNLSYEADPTNYELYIQPYVRAEINVDKQTGEVSITGWEDEASIKNEMSDTANRRATIGGLDELKPTIEDDGSALSELDKYVGHVNRYSAEARKEVLDALSGASLSALADSQRRGVRDHQDNLRNRIIQMGGGTNAGLTTDWQYAGIQAWAQADGSFSTSDGSGDECGYDFDTWGATVGANMDLTANTVVGLAFSASYGEIKSDGADHASGNNDAQYISFYARHQKDRWVQMLILTAGMNDMDMERRVMGYSASGDTEGTTLSAYYELGYTIGLNYEYTHILQPMISVSLTSAKVDGYTEEGSLDNAALEYDGDSYIYGKVGIGARYQGVLYETIHERNAVVEARALITQDFGDTTEAAKVSLGGSPMYEVSGADTSGTGFELGAGVSIPVEQHTTFYADADMTVAPDYTGFRVDLGVRYDF